MPFLRVRSANPADPKHVFDVSVDQAEAEPDLYVVVDKEPSPHSRPAEYAEPKSAPKKAPRKPARKPAVKNPPAPPAQGDKPGETEKETA